MTFGLVAAVLLVAGGARALDVSIFTEDYYFPVVSDGETIKNFGARAAGRGARNSRTRVPPTG